MSAERSEQADARVRLMVAKEACESLDILTNDFRFIFPYLGGIDTNLLGLCQTFQRCKGELDVYRIAAESDPSTTSRLHEALSRYDAAKTKLEGAIAVERLRLEGAYKIALTEYEESLRSQTNAPPKKK